jgi:hypothetical protein
LIDEQSFNRLCDDAWLKEKEEGTGRAFWLDYRAVPVLYEIKSALCVYLAIENEYEGVQLNPAEETGNDAYQRRIGEIVADRKSEPFDHNAYLLKIIKQAEEEYRDARGAETEAKDETNSSE